MKNVIFSFMLVLFTAVGASAQKTEVFTPGGKAIRKIPLMRTADDIKMLRDHARYFKRVEQI
jgi:hypothetical protein